MFNRLPASPTDYERMPQWGRQHLSMLGATALTCGACVLGARAVRDTAWEEPARRLLGWAHLGLGTAWTVISLDPRQFDARESLPLHLCDVLRPILALGLITGDERAVNLTYFWGLVLNPQAIITPDVIYYWKPNPVRFATYWFFHIAALATPLAQTFGLGYRPTWRGFRHAVAVTPVWMAVALAVNARTQGNYGFLSHAPGSSSVIDLLKRLGPWPTHVVIETVAVAGLWAGITAPWQTAKARRGTVLGPRRLMRRKVRKAAH